MNLLEYAKRTVPFINMLDNFKFVVMRYNKNKSMDVFATSPNGGCSVNIIGHTEVEINEDFDIIAIPDPKKLSDTLEMFSDSATIDLEVTNNDKGRVVSSMNIHDSRLSITYYPISSSIGLMLGGGAIVAKPKIIKDTSDITKFSMFKTDLDSAIKDVKKIAGMAQLAAYKDSLFLSLDTKRETLSLVLKNGKTTHIGTIRLEIALHEGFEEDVDIMVSVKNFTSLAKNVEDNEGLVTIGMNKSGMLYHQKGKEMTKKVFISAMREE